MENTEQKIETYHVSEPEKNNNTLVYVFAGLAAALLIVLIIVLTGKSNYEKGNEYISESQYTQALAEFKKVDANDKDYLPAQSRINYVSGIIAYNSGLRKETVIFLSKVEPSDEYYISAQAMLQKVNTTIDRAELEMLRKSLEPSADTVRVNQQTTVKSDASIVKNYIANTENLINRFQSSYQSAKTANAESKKNYLNDMNGVYERFIKLQFKTPQKNSMLSELNRLVKLWMEKRMELVDRLIIDNKTVESVSTRSILQEGDRVYDTMLNQLNRVKNYYSI